MTTTDEQESTRQVTIKTAELGHTFTEKELADQCKAIIGGVAWPGRRAGFGAVLGLDRREFLEGSHLVLLDEVESYDLGELTQRCIALDLKYKPLRWAGDDKNTAAGRLIMENSGWNEQRRFHVSHSPPTVPESQRHLRLPGHDPAGGSPLSGIRGVSCHRGSRFCCLLASRLSVPRNSEGARFPRSEIVDEILRTCPARAVPDIPARSK